MGPPPAPGVSAHLKSAGTAGIFQMRPPPVSGLFANLN